jgi:hypothetical protein
MPENDDNETVADILKRKLGKIRQAPLDPGSPSWDDILGETWQSIKRKARQRKTGYRTFRKLLTDGRFDKD